MSSMMKVLFLDIDGVLNSSASVHVKIGPNAENSEAVRQMLADGWLEYNMQLGLVTVNPTSVALLNELLERSGADLVLCSSHRKYGIPSSGFRSPLHLDRLRLYLETMGVKVPKNFDITPPMTGQRWTEVQAWINAHADTDLRYTILDDGTDFRSSDPHVRTDAEHGLTFKDFVEASKHLGVETQTSILLGTLRNMVIAR